MKEFMAKMVPVEPKEHFPFHCQQCGACCRHVKESVPLEIHSYSGDDGGHDAWA